MDAPSIDLIRIRSGAGLLAKPWIIAREIGFLALIAWQEIKEH
jgi:hypothetical protein